MDYAGSVPRRLPPPVAAVVLLAALASGCAGGGAEPTTPADAVTADEGAAAREAALERIAAGGGRVAATTPDLIGRTPTAARTVLAEAGLELHLVPFDRLRPITVQWPAAGQPVPLDGVIEAWLGRPPTDGRGPGAVGPGEADGAHELAAVPTPTPPPTPGLAAPTPSAVPPTEVTDGVAAASDVTVAYILPPHTAGRLRTNPRQLPALPLGTQLTGTASWYGPGFHGLRTACGGIYDQNGATIAARELRCGTVVRITGPTGLTVEATVTDWGPAEWTGRRFDLSAAVFNAIAPLGAGVVPVRVVTANVPS
jgi:hypothetical protein